MRLRSWIVELTQLITILCRRDCVLQFEPKFKMKMAERHISKLLKGNLGQNFTPVFMAYFY